MAAHPTASDWAGARGAKWLAHVDGIESMLMPVDEPLIRALELDVPFRIAEIGCGAGATALNVLGRAPKGTVIHGFDISPALIELARKRASADERAGATSTA